MNIGLYIESTVSSTSVSVTNFLTLDIPPLARITKSAVSLGLFSKVSVHFFYQFKHNKFSIPNNRVVFKLFNKIALKSFLFISGLSNRFSGFTFLWIKYCLFHQQYLHPLVRLSHNKFVTTAFFIAS